LLFEKPPFPAPVPFLELLFPRDRGFGIFEHGVPDQFGNAIVLGETFKDLVLVLPDALSKVRGHADVERSIALAGQNVDEKLLQAAGREG